MRLDEMDRTIYNTFCGAANSLSQLYSQAMNLQRISFQAGERHAVEKLFQWILRQQEGSRVTTADILPYLQNELDYGAEESPMSPRPSFHQNPQTATHMNALSAPFSSTIGQGARSGDYQGKTSEFSNAISSPVRGSLQHHQSVHQVGYHSNNVVSSSSADGHQQNGEANSSIFNDYMDMPMHADSPVYE
ncbi:hypothetical protein V6N12_059694 [Hibiscus sabdariffa]|uniref:Holocarboxylase synthetase n=1 Tax=Hibiscus sabdariffa TaxID=183260 RepID=A0ABR2EVT6_9ROSI